MKKNAKLLLLLVLLSAGFKGFSQCSCYFFAYPSQGGNCTFFDSTGYGRQALWDFGDGTTSTDNGWQVQHGYTQNGAFQVCLTVTDTANGGCTSTYCDSVHIDLCTGSAQYTIQQTGYGDFSFSPANSLSNLSSPTVLWDFGDGTISTNINATHHYNSDGNYYICLTVNSPSSGCTNNYCDYRYVQLCNLRATFHQGDSLHPGSSRTFYIDNPLSTCTYSWSFGDGATATGDSASHVYATSGYYMLCLIAHDTVNGCVDSSCNYAYFERCALMGSWLETNSNGLDASFNLHAYGPYADSLTYNWTFPGGAPSSSTDRYPTVTYNSYSTYPVLLVVTTPAGCTDTFGTTITTSPPRYSITGTISKVSSGACGWVYLIRQDSIGHLVLVNTFYNYDSLGAGCGGYYQFNNLPADTYYVKAALGWGDPDSVNYIPTYYGDVLTWSAAIPVNLANGSVNGVDIHLVPGSNPGGPGFVEGYVSQGAGLAIGGSHYNRSTGDPIGGEQINLLTSADVPVAYTFTDGSGHYRFNNLALGSYKLYAEELNKLATPIPFTLTAQSPSQSNVNITVNSNSAVAGIDDLGQPEITGLYPNPVVTTTQLQISSKQSTDAVLKLIDVTGRMAMERKVKINGGDNTFSIDMSDFANGVYQLVLQTEVKRLTYKLVKTK